MKYWVKVKIDWKYFDSVVHSGVDLLRKINSYGYDAYVVGGCVRDIILWYMDKKGNPNIHDVDIATNMPIEELYKKFRCTSNNGEEHGTILVFNDDIPFEVTQFRSDGTYSDGRHPDSVVWADTFEEDSKRRDFTINAMGIDYAGNVIDYHGGIEDLKNKVLRTVGVPTERFGEDALRIIRAIRFAARFDMTIDNDTFDAIVKMRDNLDNIAMERVSAELKKTAEYGIIPFANVVRNITNSEINKVVDPRNLIDWDYATYYTFKRKSRHIIPELANDPMTAFVLLMCASKDYVAVAQHFKLETEYSKCAAYVYGNRDLYINFTENINSGKNLIDTVKMVTNKYFKVLLEIAYIMAWRNGTIAPDSMARVNKIIKFGLSKQQLLSKAVQEKGYSGKEFGIKLRELTEWFYNEILNGNTNIEYTEILEHV